jgi:hypothetical protein
MANATMASIQARVSYGSIHSTHGVWYTSEFFESWQTMSVIEVDVFSFLMQELQG